MNGTSIGAVAVMGGGVLFLWSGYHGAGLTASLRQLLAGQQPSAANVAPVTGGAVSSAVSGAAALLGSYGHAALEQLWTSNGGSPATANVAAAVAQAESGGSPSATSANPDGGTNAGLWQLDTLGKGAGYTAAQLADPATNARVTIMASANGTDWSAWAAYASGAYRQYLGAS